MKLIEWEKAARLLMKRDKKLAPYIRKIGKPTVSLERDPYRALVRSILSQQLATRAAQTIIGRFQKLNPPFPTAAFVLTLSPEELRAVGISQQKASYLKDLATRWKDSSWRRGWSLLPDEELIARLTEIKGVGEWTAHMFLIFSLGRHNILPVGDFGVRRGVQLLYSLKRFPEPKELPKLLKHWEGAYSVGAWYLWKAQDQKLLVP